MYTTNFYSILEIGYPATQEEVKKAYHNLAKKEHPDTGGNSDKMKLINQAYEILGNIRTKTKYDAWFVKTFIMQKPSLQVQSGLVLSDLAKNAMKQYEEYTSKSSNPKWHRAPEEKKASSDFYLRNYRTVSSYEQKICNNGKPFDKTLSITVQINACQKSIDAFNELRDFCYESYGGTIYFQDHWEYCHNSREECFSFVDHLEERLNYLLENEENLRYRERKLKTLHDDLIKYISNHQNILQKNIYKDFNPILKYDIQRELRELERENIILREKKSGSFLLVLIK